LKDGDYGIRARRSTRIGLRTAALVMVAGAEKPLQTWTSSVNKHGVRLDSKTFVDLGEDVTVKAENTGSSAKGKVVWSCRKADSNGYFEFAVEFDKPVDLFGIQFPEDPERKQPTEEVEAVPGSVLPASSADSVRPADAGPEAGGDTLHPASTSDGRCERPPIRRRFTRAPCNAGTMRFRVHGNGRCFRRTKLSFGAGGIRPGISAAAVRRASGAC
jgi:hypothetical protein